MYGQLSRDLRKLNNKVYVFRGIKEQINKLAQQAKNGLKKCVT